MEFATMVTIAAAEKRLCPFRNDLCRPRECMLTRWSKSVDRDTGERLIYCGSGGYAGAWNPRAASRVREKSPTRAHAGAPARDPPVFGKNSPARVVTLPVDTQTEDGGELI